MTHWWHSLFTILLLGQIASASEISTACVSSHRFSDEQLQATTPQALTSSTTFDHVLRLNKIRVFRQDIFSDPQNLLYRKMNQWHAPTRLSTIHSLLPFESGDQVTAMTLAEAERLLRARPYFYDARILINRICQDSIDIDIVVREVWTLTPTLSFSRQGGESEYEIGLADSNWRGSGRDLSFSIEADADDTQFAARFKDHSEPDRWLRSVIFKYGDESHRYALQLQKPFHSTHTPTAQSIRISDHKFNKRLYVLGDEVARFESEQQFVDLYTARASFAPQRQDRFSRLYFGIRYNHEQLAEVQNLGFQAQDRRFLYPYVAWQLHSNDYARVHDLQHLGRDEHINIGWQAHLSLGYASHALASNQSAILYQTGISKSWLVSQRHYATASLDFAGHYRTNEDAAMEKEVKNQVAGLHVAYLHAYRPHIKLLLSLDLKHGRNLDHANFLELGGSNGMRGYKNHFQTGSRLYRLLMEYRYDTQIRPLDLFALGFVGFFEAGRAWFSNSPRPWQSYPARDLSNVGIGLRLHSIRTGSDQTIHIDLAKPINSIPEASGYELTLTVRKGI